MATNLTPRILLVLGVLGCLIPAFYEAPNSTRGYLEQKRRFEVTLNRCLKHGEAALPDPGVQFPDSNSLFSFSGNNPNHLDMIRRTADGRPEFFRTVTLAEYLNTLARMLLKGTSYEDKFAIDSPPNDNDINLYFLDCNLSNLVPNFAESSCTYVGYDNSIVCSRKFFDSRYAQIDNVKQVYDLEDIRVDSHVPIGLNSYSNLHTVKTALKQNITTWIIGHEIGHAVLHKKFVLGSNALLHWSSKYNKQEQDADNFVATRIAQNAELVAMTGLGVVLGEFIEQEYRSDLKQEYPSLSAEVISTRFLPTVIPVMVFNSPGDIPMLVRALRMRIALQSAGFEVDKTGYYEAIERNITVANNVRTETIRWFLWAAVAFSGVVAMTALLVHSWTQARGK